MDLIDKYLGEATADRSWKEFYDMGKDTSGKTFKHFSKKYAGFKYNMPHVQDALSRAKSFGAFKKMISKFNDEVTLGETNLLAAIGSMGKMPGKWGERLGSFGTVLATALKKAGVEIHGIEPIGKFENEITVSYNGKKKKVKLDNNSSAAKVVKKITGKYEG